MECTKSNGSPSKEGKKNIFTQLSDLWKSDVNWNNHTDKEKIICIVLGICMAVLFSFGSTVLAIPAIVGIVYSLRGLVEFKVEE